MSLTKQQVTALYIAVYNRAPDAAGLEYWTTADATYAEVASGFVGHPVFEAEYGGLTNQQKVEKFYTNILGSEGDTAGIEWWVARLDAGEDIGVVLSEFLDISLTGDFTDDADAQMRQDTLLNKVQVAIYYAETMGDKSNMSGDIDPNSADIVNDPAFKAAQAAIAGVNNTPESVTDAETAIDNNYAALTGETFFLTEVADRDTTQPDGFIKGTAGNDTFIADVVQVNGLQANTLGTGDRLDGGAGNDTLQAQVTSGVNAGGSSGMAIQAQTKNIENLKFEAVQTNATAMAGPGANVFVNAKDMTEVNYIGSERSNASLTVQDLTSKGVAGGTANMTVGMKYTGNADSQWNESDLKVLFDQDYLTRTSDTENGWSYEILNQASWDINSSEPVKGFPLERITFTLDVNEAETKYSLDFTAEDRADLVTQQDLVNALNTKLAELNVSGLEFKLGAPFNDGDGRTSQSINLVNSDEAQEVVKGTVGLDEDSLAGNLYWNNKLLEDVVEYNPVSINVELEKVGRAGDGGELVIGSMNKGSDNVWNAVNTVGENTVSGVEVFNVTVDGGKAESSSLSGMHSTNNNLREVNVVSADGSDANLWIGNSNTHTPTFTHTYRNGTVIQYVTEDILTRNANALKDVRVFDASNFNGDLHLQAALTGEVTEKYLADDQGDFVYSGGKGNDSINIAISADNLVAAGTATHGDFTLEINGGAGHDTITVGIYGLTFPQSPTLESIIDENGNDIKAEGLPALADAYPGSPWYENQKTNANLNINAGDGNDTVNLLGSGDWIVNLGAGDDVIYVANEGPKSSWIFNATTPGTYHYENGWVGAIGGGNPNYNLYKVGVMLTFEDHKGGQFELGFVVEPDTTNPHKTSQKTINEAIKNAIENDIVFSKLIETKTGQMAQTLIIDSLVDGETELEIAFEQLPIGAGQLAVNTFNDTYGSNITENELAQAYAQNPSLDTTLVDAAFANTGYIAGHEGWPTYGDQTIEGGKGDDVLVLSTSDDQIHTLVYNDFDNGKDTILNFTGYGSGSAGAFAKTGNKLDLSSYDAEYADFGFYTGATWNIGGANNDLGGLGALAAGDTFLRINEEGDGVYTIEAWKTSVAGNATNSANIEKLDTVGTLDFGGNISFDITSFII